MNAGRLKLAGAVLAAVLAISACGGDDNNGDTSITQGQADIIGNVAVSEVGNLASSLTHLSSPGLGGLAGGFFGANSVGDRVLFSRMKALNPRVKEALSAFRADECAPDESDETDTDEDGVPDDDVATFSALNCTSTDTTEENLITTTITGTIRIRDTDDANTFFGYSVGIANLTISISDTLPNTADLSVTVTGDFAGDVGTALANGTQNIRTTLRINGTKAIVEHANFAINYEPTSGTIDPGDTELPPGELTLNGAYNWDGSYQGAEGSFGFALTTPDPLVYNGCDDDQFVFESGEMRGVIQLKRSVGFSAVYSGCGVAPVVTVFSNSALR